MSGEALTIDAALKKVADQWQSHDIYEMLLELKTIRATLTRTQEECTQLLIENRDLRDRLANMTGLADKATTKWAEKQAELDKLKSSLRTTHPPVMFTEDYRRHGEILPEDL